MSSNDKKTSSNFDKEKLRKYGGKFAHYFDMFYLVVKGLVGVIFILLLVLGSLAGGTVIGYFASLVENIPAPTHAEMETQVYDYNKKSTIYYADNSQISDLRSDLLRTPISLEDISPLITNAVIATEDENFYTHEGIVPKALIRAGLQEFSGATMVSGGSTLTQQLIKQQILSAEVTHSRKATEILYATHLENSFEKDEILEAYLNISPFGRNNLGQNIAGVEEAAQGIFGIPATQVNLPQAAFLAGLPQSPITFNPYTQFGTVKEDLSAGKYRQLEVLYSMYREGYISQEDYDAAREYDIAADFLTQENEEDSNTQSYVYDLIERESRKIFILKLMRNDELSEDRISEILNENRMVTEEMLADDPELSETIYQNVELQNEYTSAADFELKNGGYDVYSTIDPAIHKAINRKINETQDSFGLDRSYTWTDLEGVTHTSDEFPVQVSGTLLDNATGRVIAFVGGRDYEVSQHNNAFDSHRLSGSVLKPITTFGPALAENIITPATIIPDEKWVVPSGGGTHNVTNIGRTTNQWRDVRQWLKVSQNIPTSRLYVQMMNDGINIPQYVRALGIGPDSIGDGEFANASTALGGFNGGPTATEIAGAYAAIGNGGVFNEPYVIERIVNSNGEVVYQHEQDPVRVWSEAANYLLYDMLRDVVTPGGTGRLLRNYTNHGNMDLAAKTGTSDAYKDVWFAGVTPKMSLTTWMGYPDSNISLQDFNGQEPYQRNMRNWANIINTIREVNPEVLGMGENMPQPAGVTQTTVLAETGMKPGKVTLPNKSTYDISGSTKSELFRSDNVPGKTTYDFAAGASDSEIRDFWKKKTDKAAKDKAAKDKEAKDKVEEEKDKEEAEAKKKEEEEKKAKEEAEKKKKEAEEKAKADEKENDNDDE